MGKGEEEAGSMDRSSKLSRSSCGLDLAAGAAACTQQAHALQVSNEAL